MKKNNRLYFSLFIIVMIVFGGLCCHGNENTANSKISTVFRDPVSQEKYNRIHQLEPSVAVVCEQVASIAQLQMVKHNSVRASKWRALLPGINASFGQREEVLGSETNNTSDTEDIWEVKASWDLADIVWGKEIPFYESESRQRSSYITKLKQQATDIYFLRRESQVRCLEELNSKGAVNVQSLMKVEKLTAQLDVLTDGFFSNSTAQNFNEILNGDSVAAEEGQ